jgi:hypothetical protein
MSEVTENGSKRRKISIDSHPTSQTETGTKMINQIFSSKALSNSSFEVNFKKILNCGKSFSEPEINQGHFQMDNFSVKNYSIKTTKLKCNNNVLSTETSSDCKVVLETEKKIFFCNFCNAAFNNITLLMVHSAKTHFQKDVDIMEEEAARNS